MADRKGQQGARRATAQGRVARATARARGPRGPRAPGGARRPQPGRRERREELPPPPTGAPPHAPPAHALRRRGAPRPAGRVQLRQRMRVPRVEKVVLNIGLGEALTNPQAMDNAVRDLETITGQRPVVTKARKSIAAFKLREGIPIGCMVTLRGARMYDFLDKLINVALARVRDFNGVSPESFDGRGNYNLGLREQLIFPEIAYDQIDRVRGDGRGHRHHGQGTGRRGPAPLAADGDALPQRRRRSGRAS